MITNLKSGKKKQVCIWSFNTQLRKMLKELGVMKCGIPEIGGTICSDVISHLFTNATCQIDMKSLHFLGNPPTKDKTIWLDKNKKGLCFSWVYNCNPRLVRCKQSSHNVTGTSPSCKVGNFKQNLNIYQWMVWALNQKSVGKEDKYHNQLSTQNTVFKTQDFLSHNKD